MFAAATLAVVLVVGPATARADANGAAEQARHFIATMANDVIHSLTGKDLSEHERNLRFRKAMKRYFAIENIARWVVGRAAWRHATGEQRQVFVKTFEDLMVETYAHRFGEYHGETLKIDDVVDLGNGDMLVRTRILRPEAIEPLKVDWRVRARRNGTREVVDIVVEGLSMAQKQRAEFGSFLRQHDHSLAALIGELRHRIENVQAQRNTHGS